MEMRRFKWREIGPRDARLEWHEPPSPSEYRDVARIYAGLLAKCHAKAGRAGDTEPATAVIAAALNGRVEVFVKRLTCLCLGLFRAG